MDTPSTPWISAARGVGVVGAALAAATAVFLLLARSSCGPSDCYGGGNNPLVPLVGMVVVFAVVLLVGLEFLRSRIPSDAGSASLSRMGMALIALAVPAALVSYAVVTFRYCSNGCSGDYLVLAFAAMAATVVVAVIVFVVGMRLLAAARHDRRHMAA